MRLFGGFSLLALTAFLVSCSTPSPTFSSVVRSWRGALGESIMGAWGYPLTIKRLQNGGRQYYYRLIQKRIGKQLVTLIPSHQSIKVSAKTLVKHKQPLSCDVTFTVNPDNQIVAVKYRGQYCVADSIFAAQMSHPIITKH